MTDPFLTPPPPPAQRVLRRSSSDRVLAGVSGGLGEYFGLDPVLFRVLFAVTSFFGGAGILAYLAAWAVIPEQGTADPPLDRFARELRRRRVPLSAIVIGAAVVAWLLLFGWWAPGSFWPLIVVLVVLGLLLRRRGGAQYPGWTPYEPAQPFTDAEPVPGVRLSKDAPDAPPFPDQMPFDTYLPYPPPSAPSGWLPEMQAYVSEARDAGRRRRHRAAPVRWTTLAVLVVTMATLALADSIGGIVIPAYLWTALGIVLGGLFIGAVLRRTPWSISVLLLPITVGLIALSGTHASLSDGTGQRVWVPTTTSELRADYRLAVGQLVLDLRSLPTDTTARTVHVTAAAGQVRILLPANANVTVHGAVRWGTIELDGDGEHFNGGHVTRDIPPPAGATGTPITVDVALADGDISVERS